MKYELWQRVCLTMQILKETLNFVQQCLSYLVLNLIKAILLIHLIQVKYYVAVMC